MVDVVNGAGAGLLATDVFTSLTVTAEESVTLSASAASASQVGLYFLPFFSTSNARNFFPFTLNSADTSQYSDGTNASISRSLSTMIRSATD
ncbi:unknown [Acidiphilium sp. CAG:727]|nr:unknown [Acidiphilium sp. CAG:727]